MQYGGFLCVCERVGVGRERDGEGGRERESGEREREINKYSNM